MLTSKTYVDGKDYHFDTYTGKFLTDERGELIPAHICICFARDRFECGCGAWDCDIDYDQDVFDG